jgi:hypothetical protein
MFDMMNNDESFVSTLIRVKVEDDGQVTQDLEVDTMHGLVIQFFWT